MENILDLRSVSMIVGGLLAVVVIGLIVARVIRSRAARVPPPETPPVNADAAYLDSSHIIDRPGLGKAQRGAGREEGATTPRGGAGNPDSPDRDPRQ